MPHVVRRRTRALALASAAALLAVALPATTATAQLPGDDDGGPAGTAEVCEGLTDRAQFDDVPENQVFSFWIDCLGSYGIVDGFADDTYRPREFVRRDQMAKFIANTVEQITGDPLDASDPGFDDVPDDSPFAVFIAKIANADIVDGFADDTFRPRALVKRDQMAKFIVNAIEHITGEAMPEDGETFEDVDEDSPFFVFIDKVETAGIVEGFDDGTYRPRSDVRRDQMAKFVTEGAGFTFDEGAFPLEEFSVSLSWLAEVDTPAGEPADDPTYGTGQPGAEGQAELRVNAVLGCIDGEVAYDEVDGPFADGPGLHLHEGNFDENGPVVVLFDDGAGLDASAEDGTFEQTACVDDGDSTLYDTVDQPADYYVNLHSEDFAGGAIRGQLPTGQPQIEDATAIFNVTADPVQVPDGGGEPGAVATFQLTLDSVNQIVCYQIDTGGVSGDYESPAVTATHIHQAPAGETGPARVVFPDPEPTDADSPDGQRRTEGCHRTPTLAGVGDPDAGGDFDLAEIEDDPSAFYVDIHTVDHPGGAVRGQFSQLSGAGS